jgi:hypothetical protein
MWALEGITDISDSHGGECEDDSLLGYCAGGLVGRYPDDAGSEDLWNIGLRDHTAQQPKWLSFSEGIMMQSWKDFICEELIDGRLF